MSQDSHPQATSDLFRLDARVALVSGGAGMFGSQICRALAKAGALVVIASRHRAQCEVLAEALRRENLRADAEELDLSSEESIRGLNDKILSAHGRLDVLVNNAVARAGGDLHHTSAVDWESTMKVNSTGLFLACQVFSEPMQRARRGSIINIASIYGMVGPDFNIYEGTKLTMPVNYAFAKGGMINLTRYLASFLARYNVRVNCLSPGGLLTSATPPEFIPNYTRKTPLHRMAEDGDIDGPVVFLASDASRYITGQNIPVDGGWTAI
jgi:NAD(P)-dependent dehydrogenase (short-subunit alcohol dehydrogenase family)